MTAFVAFITTLALLSMIGQIHWLVVWDEDARTRKRGEIGLNLIVMIAVVVAGVVLLVMEITNA